MGTELTGKVIIVTGAATGIGKSAAECFAESGAKVVVSDIDVVRGNEVSNGIGDAGGDAIFVEADVADDSAVKNLVNRTVDHYGALDGAFNNAGIEGAMGATHECTMETWDRTMAINLKGVWQCMRHQIPAIIERGGGSIVNMSSVAGLIGFPGLPAYVASKHAVLGLTKTAALEYATQNIRVNAVCPGVIHTEMIDRITQKDPETEAGFIAYEPIGRMGTPEEIAEAAKWLLSDASSFVTGSCLPVDGGFVAQ